LKPKNEIHNFHANNMQEKISRFWLANRSTILSKYSAKKEACSAKEEIYLASAKTKDILIYVLTSAGRKLVFNLLCYSNE
jgi:uncharacterized protein (AIM24 family)